MKTRHRRIYRALTHYGFSAWLALEIVIDAERGVPHALTMCRTVLRIMRQR